DPINSVTPVPKRMADFYGSSVCLNTVLTRLGKEAAVVIPSETFESGEIWAWHQLNPLPLVKIATTKTIPMSSFYDAHSSLTAEKTVVEQCAPPSAPGIGPVP